MTGWIDVKQELPEINRVVMVCYPSGYDGSLIYAWGGRIDGAEGWLWGLVNFPGIQADYTLHEIEADDDLPVTHWMHLPAAPTKQAAEG